MSYVMYVLCTTCYMLHVHVCKCKLTKKYLTWYRYVLNVGYIRVNYFYDGTEKKKIKKYKYYPVLVPS